MPPAATRGSPFPETAAARKSYTEKLRRAENSGSTRAKNEAAGRCARRLKSHPVQRGPKPEGGYPPKPTESLKYGPSMVRSYFLVSL